ncbi:hypothetical protein [Streptomyces sp. MP131-18]|uniref:hypothetical protein n=1 Tax=Streptomyces sp. MP131-18 TaxID=1857892 RepID=UPI00097C4550|nr:hypothetical protein [Streptomyces sp. MP131-18]ONK10388.1 hypothetical protein STBA_11100 [Streptomyces sp. MP131-18]
MDGYGDIKHIASRVDALRREHSERDARHQLVTDARAQRIDNIAPGSLPDAWPRPITANAIDNAARQLAENLAALPSINCASGTATTESAKRRVAKRTKIAYSYVIDSGLRKQLPTGADWYNTYASMPIIVEPDFAVGAPRFRIENPMNTYVECDRWGKVRTYVKVYREAAGKLAAAYPEHAAAIYGTSTFDKGCSPDSLLEVVRYEDSETRVLYMPERRDHVLLQAPNPLGKVMVAIAEKPKWDDQERGQYDDVVYPHLAQSKMAMFGLEATQKSVRAPLAVPEDVTKIAFGDDAVIRTRSPRDVIRVGQDMPTAAWQQQSLLAEEVQRGTRTPRAATGDIDASIITGKGVEALGAGYDTQIATGQLMIGYALEQALELAFEMDEKFWPDAEKQISGVINGTPFEEKYTPSKDIAGSYRVSCSYGFASGMNQHNALVFLLQLRGDQLVPRDFVQRQLPMDVDVAELQRQVDNEGVEDALKQGLYAMLASLGVMMQQGMDPTQVLRQTAELIKLRQKLPFHEAYLKAFEPKEEEAAPADPLAALMGGGAPGGAPPGPAGVAPGQAQLGPGGAPDMMQLLAGLTSGGSPELSASVSRRVPA